jgi:hypothetical protein
MILKINKHYFPIHYSSIGLRNGSTLCSLCGTDWMMYIHFSPEMVKIINPIHTVLSFLFSSLSLSACSQSIRCKVVSSFYSSNFFKEVTELLSDRVKSVLPTQIALLTSDFWLPHCAWVIATGENMFQEDYSVLCCASDGQTTLHILYPLACLDVHIIPKEWLFGRTLVS